MCKMNMKCELKTLEDTIHELKMTQAQLRERISLNINKRTEISVQKIQCLEEHMDKLEEQCAKQSNELKCISQQAVTMLNRIEALSQEIKQTKLNEESHKYKTSHDSVQDVSNANTVEKSGEGRSDKQSSIKTTSAIKREDLYRTNDLTITCANVTMPPFTFSSYQGGVDRKGNAVCGSKHTSLEEKACNLKMSSVTKQTDNIISMDNGERQNCGDIKQGSNKTNKDDYTEIYSEMKLSDQTETVDTDDKNHDYTADNIKDEVLPGFTLTTSVMKVGRNNFGYKQKCSDMDNDNRVTFHSVLPRNEGNFTVKSNTSEGLKKEIHTPNLKQKRANRPENLLRQTVSDQPRTIEEWFKYSNETRAYASLRLASGAIKRGRGGRDCVLVLDTSEYMRGGSFERMKSIAIQYIDGIQQVGRTVVFEDSIGLAVFGGQTRLIQECTTDYDLIKSQIGQIEPSGDSALLGGLLMGLAGVYGGIGTTVGEFSVKGHMVVFTDAEAAMKSQGTTIGGVFHTQDLYDTADISRVIELIASYSAQINYVPVGEQQCHAILEQAVQETRGKIFKPSEIYRLIRMTQVLFEATQIAADLRFSPDSNCRESIKRYMNQASRISQDRQEESIDMVLFLLGTENSMYKELQCRTLQLGDRVRRGTYWIHGDQDSNMAGTVVGKESYETLRVEWDSGYSNVYLYDENRNMFALRKVNEPRRLIDDLIAVGCRVIRGLDWTYGNNDGGQGCMGTVLNVKEDGTVIVRWDCRRTGSYKVGRDGLFEVKVHIDEDSDNERSDIIQPEIISNRNRNNDSMNQSSNREPGTTSLNNDSDYIIPLNPDPKVTCIWEYKEKDTDWRKYPKEINIRIEKAFRRNPNGKTIIKMKHSTYIVYFTRMLQESQATKENIPVRRKK